MDLPELEVTIKFKYTPNAENYDHLDPVTVEGIIATDKESFIDEPYLLTEYLEDGSAEITIEKAKD